MRRCRGFLRKALGREGRRGGEAPLGRPLGHQALHQGQVQGRGKGEGLLLLQAQGLPEAAEPGLGEAPLRHQEGGGPLLAGLEALRQLVPVRPGPLALQEPQNPKLVKGGGPRQEEVAPRPHEGPQAHVGALPPRHGQEAGKLLGQAHQVVLRGEVKGPVAEVGGHLPGDEVGLGGHHLRQVDPEVEPVQLVQLLGGAGPGGGARPLPTGPRSAPGPGGPGPWPRPGGPGARGFPGPSGRAWRCGRRRTRPGFGSRWRGSASSPGGGSPAGCSGGGPGG